MAAVFAIRTLAEPDSLIRLLNQFAQRGLTPSRVEARQVGEHLEVEIEEPTINQAVAELIRHKMGNSVLIESVDLLEQAREQAE